MPYYDLIKGIVPYRDDACLNCDNVHACNVMTSLNMNQTDSQYHETHIVKVGDGADRDNYLECQSFRQYISPKDKPDIDPTFGRRLSQQEVDMMSDPKRPYPEKF